MSYIISHIIGGLGNQMFQFAAGYALSKQWNMPFKLDISDFSSYGLHNGFELPKVFPCQIQIATHKEIEALIGYQSSNQFFNKLKLKSSILFGSKCIMLEKVNYKKNSLLNPCFPLYLKGYWQNQIYFNDFSQDIRRAFLFSKDLTGQNIQIANSILNTNSISLHVRRGDYATNPKTVAHQGLIPTAYFRLAIDYIANKVNKPNFFIFSDDIEWARLNINIDYPTQFINHNNGENSFYDMQLMSKCCHHIIANSSFSWWGAWLNPSQQKIVIGPKKWFANTRRLNNPCPPEWILI
jgi:hypothetical protein